MEQNYELLNKDLAYAGIYRVKLIEDGSDIRAYIPGISQINPFDASGNLIQDIVDKNKSAFPIIDWCAYNLESCDLANISEPMWCMFECGDVKRPVVLSYTFPKNVIEVTVYVGGSGGGTADGDGTSGGTEQYTDELESGYIVDAVFTAYYATPDGYSSAENRLQGGPIAANGETLDYRNNTMAAPSGIPFNSNIQVMDTGTGYDGSVYRVNDRGGAIKVVNGVYHFDILMKDRETAYAFGKRKGKAVIGKAP